MYNGCKCIILAKCDDRGARVMCKRKSFIFNTLGFKLLEGRDLSIYLYSYYISNCRKKALKILFLTLFFFKRFYLFIFRENGREEEREGEKYQCVVASGMPPTGDLACNPGMCPDWGLNCWHFGSPSGTQSTEPHQPGQEMLFWMDE